jgi:single-strand DNA-binding protein
MSLYTYDKTQVLGTVGRDAEMRYMPNGDAVTKFSVAVDRSYKPKDGDVIKRTIWYSIQVFGKFAETCASIKKGDKIFAEGELQADWANGSPRIWQGTDGGNKCSFELTASTIRFLSPKRETVSAAETQQNSEQDFPF